MAYLLYLRDVQLSTEEQRFGALLLKMLFSKLPQCGGHRKVAHGVYLLCFLPLPIFGLSVDLRNLSRSTLPVPSDGLSLVPYLVPVRKSCFLYSN